MTQKGCWHFIYVSDKQHSALHHKCDYSIFLFCRCSCQRTYKHSFRQRGSLVRLEPMRKTCQPRRCGPPSENHCSSILSVHSKPSSTSILCRPALKRRCFLRLIWWQEGQLPIFCTRFEHQWLFGDLEWLDSNWIPLQPSPVSSL